MSWQRPNSLFWDCEIQTWAESCLCYFYLLLAEIIDIISAPVWALGEDPNPDPAQHQALMNMAPNPILSGSQSNRLTASDVWLLTRDFVFKSVKDGVASLSLNSHSVVQDQPADRGCFRLFLTKPVTAPNKGFSLFSPNLVGLEHNTTVGFYCSWKMQMNWTWQLIK